MEKKTDAMNTKHHGFTLVELMITIAIAAILVTVAVPNFSTIIQNNRITAQANDFLTALSIARSEAVKRGQRITIASTTNNAAWQSGWTITDAANNTLYVSAGFDGNATLTNNSATTPAIVQFSANGFLSVAQPRTFQLRIPGCTGNQARNITISPSGRAAVAQVACDA